MMFRGTEGSWEGSGRGLPVWRGGAALCLALLGVLALPLSAAGHGSDVPYHVIGARNCVDGRIEISPPVRMDPDAPTNFTNPEEVQWSPDLLKWKPRRHRWKVVWQGDWYRAFTSSYGFFQTTYTLAWQSTTTNGYIYFVPVDIYRAGYYRVKNYMWWSWADGIHAQKGPQCRYY